MESSVAGASSWPAAGCDNVDASDVDASDGGGSDGAGKLDAAGCDNVDADAVDKQDTLATVLLGGTGVGGGAASGPRSSTSDPEGEFGASARVPNALVDGNATGCATT